MIPVSLAYSNRSIRMLKKPPNFVLGSSKSSTYPRGYASGFDSPAALLDRLFEHPTTILPSILDHMLGIGDNVCIGFFYPSNLVDLCDHHIGKGSLIGDIDEENNVRPSEAGVRLFDAGKALDGL